MIKLTQLLFEAIDEKHVHVISTPQNVSITYRLGFGPRNSVASIDRIEGHQWWVARVLVGDRDTRGQGIGSYILRRAVQEVLKHDPDAEILVEPGGYEGNTAQQVNFYKKNGFVDYPKYEGSLVYKSALQEALFKWSTAHHKGKVPDEVINMGHEIIGVAQKDDPDTHPEFWMNITQRPNLGIHAMDPHQVRQDVWYIEKPGQHEKGRYWILSFHENTKKWFINYVKDGEIHRQAPLENDAAVKYIANKWVKGI